jgi:ribosome biogenesis ATPase
LSNRAGIYVVAATNRPDMIDPAMLRPGRLGTSVYVDLPASYERVEILKAIIKKTLPTATRAQIDILEEVAKDPRAEGYSGADLGNLHVAAAVAALKREAKEELEVAAGMRLQVLRGVQKDDWEVALGKVKASVKDIEKYRRLKNRGM